MVKTENRIGLPLWVWWIYAILFIFSIPWYFSDDLAMKIILGLPLWLVTSSAIMLLMGLFSIYVIQYLWEEPPKDYNPE